MTGVGAQFKMPVPTGYGKNGVDFDICYRRLYIALETKVHPNTITTQQRDFLQEVKDAGGVGILAYDLDTVYEQLKRIDQFWLQVERALNANPPDTPI